MFSTSVYAGQEQDNDPIQKIPREVTIPDDPELFSRSIQKVCEPDSDCIEELNYEQDYYEDAWNIHALGDNNRGSANVEGAWRWTTGKDITIAIIDTGCRDHIFLPKYICEPDWGYDFITQEDRSQDGDGRDNDPTDEGDGDVANDCDDGVTSSSWHGLSQTSVGFTIAPEATIVPVRALGKCGGQSSDVHDAIRWAAGGHISGVPDNQHPADVINLSFGHKGACSREYQAAIDFAWRQGSLIVTSAGNDGDEEGEEGNVSDYAPANCEHVIVVGSAGKHGGIATHSNHGPNIILAPGLWIPVFSIQRPYQAPVESRIRKRHGTSYATTHVTGALALALSWFKEHAELSKLGRRDNAYRLIMETARDFPSYEGWEYTYEDSCNPEDEDYTDKDCGVGLLDVTALVAALLPPARFDEFSISRDMIRTDQEATVHWYSSYATECHLRGDSRTFPSSGEHTFLAGSLAPGDYRWDVSCYGPSGASDYLSISLSVLLGFHEFYFEPASITVKESTTVHWSAPFAEFCMVIGDENKRAYPPVGEHTFPAGSFASGSYNLEVVCFTYDEVSNRRTATLRVR